MHLSLEWLADAVTLPTGTTTDEVTDALLRIGFEVEGVHTVPPTEGQLVVGTVLSIEELTGLKKPIRFCTVDVGPGNGPDGSDEPRGIICGATNFVESATPWWWHCRERCCPAASRSRPARPTAGSPTG